MPAKTKSVDLGLLQEQFEAAQRNWNLTEKTLARAGELRDGAKKKFEAADTALQAAVRSVRG